MKQARKQLKNAEFIAAVASASCDMQLRLRYMAWEMAMSYSKKSPRYHKTTYIAETLRGKQYLSGPTYRSIQAVLTHSSSILEGLSECDGVRARYIVEEVESVNAAIDETIKTFGRVGTHNPDPTQWAIVRRRPKFEKPLPAK